MRSIVLVILATVALVAAACGNSAGEAAKPSEPDPSAGSTRSSEYVEISAPGVSETEIHVEGVASITNPLGGKYDTAADGVNAYFEMINSEGGIYGRKLVLDGVRDDKVANNTAEIKGLIDSNSSFAALPIASLLFTGADELVDSGIPTFGWSINPEWEGTTENPKSNLYGQAGSFICLGCEQPVPAYLTELAERTKVGILAYAVPQSADCAAGWGKSIEQWNDNSEVAFTDSSLAYGTTDLSVQVQKMKDAGVDMVMTCMDNNGVVTLAKEMKKQQLDAIQFLPNAYDHELLEEFGDLFEGSYVMIGYSPLETPDDLKPDGLVKYEEWIDKTDGALTENSLVAWLNAALFVAGLEAAGPEFDQQKVVDAINSMDDFKADGMLPFVDWTTGHIDRQRPNCNALLEIKNSEFVPTAEEGIFTCFDLDSATLDPTYR